jgi:hypothetical protein
VLFVRSSLDRDQWDGHKDRGLRIPQQTASPEIPIFDSAGNYLHCIGSFSVATCYSAGHTNPTAYDIQNFILAVLNLRVLLPQSLLFSLVHT